MKIFDKLLNVTLFIVVAIWIAGQFIETSDERQQKIKDVAAAEFGTDASAATEEQKTPAGSVAVLPALSTEDINKEMVSAPRVAMFIFASWCPYCKKMFPEMVAAAKEHPDVRIVAFSIDEDPAMLRAYLDSQQEKAPFPIHEFGTPEELATLKETLKSKDIDFGGGIPFLVVVDHGYIKFKEPGMQTKEELRLILTPDGDTKPAPDNKNI